MKIHYSLTEHEYNSIEEMFEDIPIDLCEYVDCPECEGDACECCPMRTIKDFWEAGLFKLVYDTNLKLALIKPIKEQEEK